jgi:hypothetical protein
MTQAGAHPHQRNNRLGFLVKLTNLATIKCGLSRNFGDRGSTQSREHICRALVTHLKRLASSCGFEIRQRRELFVLFDSLSAPDLLCLPKSADKPRLYGEVEAEYEI